MNDNENKCSNHYKTLTVIKILCAFNVQSYKEIGDKAMIMMIKANNLFKIIAELPPDQQEYDSWRIFYEEHCEPQYNTDSCYEHSLPQ